MKVILNGFGRFGLHLFIYYINNISKSEFYISEIYDENLSHKQIIDSILNDKYCFLDSNLTLQVQENKIEILKKSTKLTEVILKAKTQLLDEQDLNCKFIFECSGHNTDADKFRKLQHFKEKKVLVSATSYNADRTLVFGYNQSDYLPKDKVISYGSCTVNAYIPLANQLHNKFNVLDSDVNVIHNIPEYKLQMRPDIFERRDCTLQKMAPKLLSFVKQDKFLVNYTVVPYSGVSRIDFRFKVLKSPKDLSEVFSEILNIKNDEGMSLYSFEDQDYGQKYFNNSGFSACFIIPQCHIKNDNIYLSAYFDTENSANRYFDLANYLIRKFKDE